MIISLYNVRHGRFAAACHAQRKLSKRSAAQRADGLQIRAELMLFWNAVIESIASCFIHFSYDVTNDPEMRRYVPYSIEFWCLLRGLAFSLQEHRTRTVLNQPLYRLENAVTQERNGVNHPPYLSHCELSHEHVHHVSSITRAPLSTDSIEFIGAIRSLLNFQKNLYSKRRECGCYDVNLRCLIIIVMELLLFNDLVIISYM